MAPPRRAPALAAGLCWLFAAAPADAADPEPVRFRTDVMAVLSKAGCNQGACHGNFNGKGGFRLSLRGDDPDFDFAALTRDQGGRRADPLRPAASLLLLKATGAVPHEGGRRFGPDSAEYDTLRRWLAAGTPADPLGLPTAVRLEATPAVQFLAEPADRLSVRVTATFSDGARRDVTRLACYELSNPRIAAVTPDGAVQRLEAGETVVQVRYLGTQATVRLAFVPARPAFAWPNPPEHNVIDRHVFAKLKALRLNPAPLCDDATFLRRAGLDTVGLLPTPDEVRAFLADRDPDKRAKLIDRLLARPEFADLWAQKWADVLRVEEKQLDRKGMQAFHGWLRDQIAAGRPLNEFARDLLAARGSTYAAPAANFYRALRDPYTRSEAAAQVFLGVRLQCARCHNHPFDRWTQQDYYGLAAFFARVQYREVENRRTDSFDKHEFVGDQIVWQDRTGEVPNPRTGAPAPPQFLGRSGPALADDADRLQALADWVADPANPFFARAQVNRVWFHLLGRGLVEPNDDFRASNPPSHPELLDELARDFAAQRFDLRYLVRLILNSRTYQASAAVDDTNHDDEVNYAHTLMRPLQAEPLLDAVAQVLETPVKFAGYPLGVRAEQLPGLLGMYGRGNGVKAGAAERFLKTFGKPDRLLSCECERADDTTLLQSFQLLTGELVNGLIARDDNRLGRLLKAGKSDEAIVAEFYLAALSRPPSAAEVGQALTHVRAAKDRRAALEDVVWGLLNAKEFLLRR
jgi:Protein of unknown function (DUF1549)/Protein of unknown function (DUF1553)